MWTCGDCAYADCCRSPHGERGLKFPPFDAQNLDVGRSPHGERGLKCQTLETDLVVLWVALLMESVD